MRNLQSPFRRVMIICEKPMSAEHIVPAWLSLHPSDEIDIFYIGRLSRFQFDIPRSLPLSNVPSIMEPKIKEAACEMLRVPKRAKLVTNHLAAATQADLIVCATTPDPVGSFHFNQWFEMTGEPCEKVLWLLYNSLQSRDLLEAMQTHRGIDNQIFQQMVLMRTARRYFDYNYMINALPVFSVLLKKAGAPEGTNHISKFMVQLLFKLADIDTPMTERDIQKMMDKWVGSGKYSPSRMGNALSRFAIVEGLEKTGLITRTKEDCVSFLTVSQRGYDLMAAMHKGMRDPDLPQRLEMWSREWPESRPAMEAYIKTMFGKQRRAL